MYRSHTCGELRLHHSRTSVTLAGWVQTVRKFGSITFVDLRDRYGITQLLFGEELNNELDQNPLGREFVVQVNGVVAERNFFPSAQMLDAFTTRLTENDTYLHSYPNQNHFNQYFNYDFGCGKISPTYIADISGLIYNWRQYLSEKKCLLEEHFDHQLLSVEKDSVTYQNITASKIIFCDGISSANTTWFSALPFSPSKGEMLLIESEDLSTEHIFKRGLMLAPLFQKNLFWVGSSYQWEYENDKPTEKFYNHTKTLLDQWLKVPFKIIDHKAALRPSTLERRPFAGFHPQFSSVGILNGMGTKGTSLAPFFANQLAQNISFDAPITAEADVKRFTRILSK